MEFYSRDIQIMRQSQMKMAHRYTQSLGVDVSIKELHKITDVFVEMCLRPMDKELKERVIALDKWLQEKKNGEKRDN